MKLTEKILNFFFPSHCSICSFQDMSANLVGVCKSCLSKANLNPSTQVNRCSICQFPQEIGSDCEYCNSRNVFYDSIIALRNRNEIEKNLMNSLKLNNAKILIRFFSLKLGKIQKKIKESNINTIVFVPSHSSNLTKRPFVIPKIIATRIAAKSKLPVYSMFEKGSAAKQSTLVRRERFFHARDAFKLKKNARISENSRILLVDDVFTTGASVNELARILRQAGAESVVVVVASRKEEGIEI
ncbi:ComF family protein [Leptospira sp. GIMC2001]|uniref:ComF family protein n=1 Tax=Leptospira sp. GIMC2001 TaxID=1513297 RepID=UPI00234B343A|nr:phosphoribosyltransferase family protein [Leptospira sp. GIMC2001]WCL50421.1 phosphoribosyltransferase family protein [Leptospira sp. GIMC2001]